MAHAIRKNILRLTKHSIYERELKLFKPFQHFNTRHKNWNNTIIVWAIIESIRSTAYYKWLFVKLLPFYNHYTLHLKTYYKRRPIRLVQQKIIKMISILVWCKKLDQCKLKFIRSFKFRVLLVHSYKSTSIDIIVINLVDQFIPLPLSKIKLATKITRQ